MSGPEFFLFLPQMRLPFPALVERARIAEAAGFRGVALMDHLAPPLAETMPMHEALIAATWVAAHTTTLKVTHLVLCDAFRSPAILAKQAVAIDNASGGRFELGIGSGSLPAELVSFGLDNPGGHARRRRLAETLEVLKLLWSGEPVHYDGEFHKLAGAQQQPTPLHGIPLVIGGAGDGLVAMAAQHADWWNLPLYALDRLQELRPRTAPARTSLQQMVAFVADEAARAATADLAARRFGQMPGGGALVADAAELREHFTALHEQGVERFYVWFADFATAGTLRGFGDHVIGRLSINA